MKNKKLIVLASASPRRREILQSLNINFTTIITNASEETAGPVAPSEFVRIVASRKGRAALPEALKLTQDALIISADTIVSVNGKILGKPRDKQDACDMLGLLQGKTHQVYTGVNLLDINNCVCKEYFTVECSDVTFRPLTPGEIREYTDSGEPMDKAGAYGIQGAGGRFVTHYTGELNNIIGLPTKWLAKFLKQ